MALQLHSEDTIQARIREAFEQYEIPVSADQTAQLSRFLRIFMEMNSTINLSAIRDPDAIIEKHFVDSIIILRKFALSGRGLDLWSGGGFPGIPLAIVCPDIALTLLDSVGKKVRCVGQCIEMLGLSNAVAIRGRAEEAGKRPGHAGQYDFVVSRATAYLPRLLEWSTLFLKPGGMLYAYKLPSNEEMTDAERACRQLGFALSDRYDYTLAERERVVLGYVKIR